MHLFVVHSPHISDERNLHRVQLPHDKFIAIERVISKHSDERLDVRTSVHNKVVALPE